MKPEEQTARVDRPPQSDGGCRTVSSTEPCLQAEQGLGRAASGGGPHRCSGPGRCGLTLEARYASDSSSRGAGTAPSPAGLDLEGPQQREGCSVQALARLFVYLPGSVRRAGPRGLVGAGRGAPLGAAAHWPRTPEPSPCSGARGQAVPLGTPSSHSHQATKQGRVQEDLCTSRGPSTAHLQSKPQGHCHTVTSDLGAHTWGGHFLHRQAPQGQAHCVRRGQSTQASQLLSPCEDRPSLPIGVGAPPTSHPQPVLSEPQLRPTGLTVFPEGWRDRDTPTSPWISQEPAQGSRRPRPLGYLGPSRVAGAGPVAAPTGQGPSSCE